MKGRLGKARWLAVLSALLPIPTPAVAAPAATDYQAENGTISKGVVESNHAGYTGTGFVNYDNVTGSYVQFAVSAASAGPASLTFRFANGTTTDRPMTITVNGTTVATGRSFPGTGAWTTWQDAVVNTTLVAGSNTIRATATTANGGPNLDRLQVGAPSDTEHPTAPGQPVCSDITFDALTLSFPASTDNVGVVAYDIYNQGQKIAEAPNPPGSPYRLTGLRPNAQYELSVFGRDASGNVSATSPEAVCTTTADPGDPTAPSAPGQPTVTAVNQTGATVSWPASTDNRGVTQYDVRSANNAVLDSVTGTPPATSKTLSTLACNTAYTIHVVAKDAAGNTSAKSPTASFTTGSCEGGNNPATPTQVSSGWSIPWDIAWAPDGSFALVTERDSFKVFKINKNGSGKTQVGTVPNAVTTDGEGGLMGVAFSPTWNGGSDQQVFFMHTASEGNRVAKMNFNGTALSGYGTILSGMRKSRYHNGGRIRFGPDGFLYVAIGDSQQGNLAQDKNALNGKILRITKTGAAAPGNPFGTAVYSYGHRNPQGLAWDSAGRLWSSELGDSTSDELNLIQPGKNYGWPTCEGSCSTAGMTNPKKTWSVASASPSGLAYANGALFMAALRGQRMWRIALNGENVGTVTSHWNGTYGRLRAVAKVPGENAIWFTTTNADNNGGQPDGSDKILRSNLTTGLTAATSKAAAPKALAADPAAMPAAPYLYLGWGNPQKPTDVMKAAGNKWFTLAFILSDGGCNPKWDGNRALTGGSDQAAINSIRAAGGDVIPSFGGWDGKKLGQACTSASALAGAYQKVINAYALKAIDIDIENTEFQNNTVQKRVIDALKIIKTNNPGLKTYVTMGTEQGGPDSWGSGLISKGAAAGLANDGWVLMPFDFGGGGTNMATLSMKASEGLKAKLKSSYGYTDDQAYRRMGISSMNGKTDVSGETVRLADFKTLLGYAQQHHLARFTFWSVNRDRACSGGGAGDDCSGVSQKAYDFTKVIAQYKLTAFGTPAARSTDWSVAMVDSTMARYTPSSLGGWSYTNGLYLYGQYLVYQRTHNPKYLAYIKAWVDRFVDSNGNIDNSFGNLDSMLSGRLLVILHHETGQARYQIAATKIRNRLKTYPRTADGGFWHATSRQHQLWGDGVFMVNPFLAEYGREFGDSAYANKETVDQLLTYASHLQRSTGLLRHAYDESHSQTWADPTTGQSPEVWCRAEGWYGMAAIDVLEVIPATHPRRAELLQVLGKLIAAYKRYQDPTTGRWFQIVDKGARSDNWTETSCSSMYTFVISRAVQRGYVDASYNTVAQHGYQGVLSKLSLDTEGRTNLKDISIGTNVGNYAYYATRDRATNDRHGLGAFLIMNEQLT